MKELTSEAFTRDLYLTGTTETALSQPLTIGVEEEFLLLDPASGSVVPAAEAVRDQLEGPAASRVVFEMARFQLEANSAVHTDLTRLQRDLLEIRTTAAAAAGRAGVRLAACGTALCGNADIPPLVNGRRYRAMYDEFRAVMRGQGVCGCHVHIGIPDREEAIQVSNHVRPWLPVLQAITANSPISDGGDTGYASWRAILMSRWPTAEPPPYFDSAEHYDRLVAGLLTSGAAMNHGMIYWLVRLSHHLPTLEFRTADVCATVEETAMFAGLVRALAATALRDVRAGVPAPQIDHTLLRAACWLSARDGLEGEAMDLFTNRRVPAWHLVRRLVDHVRPSLEESGDWAIVAPALRRLRRRGSGTARQRAAYWQRLHVPDVAAMLVEQTVAVPGVLGTGEVA